MKEISWTRAFIYAFKFLAYVILWIIVGTILIVIGSAIIGLSYLAKYGGIPGLTDSIKILPQIDPAIAIITGVILIIIGFIIIVVGYFATFFKLVSKLIVESMTS